MKHILTVFLSLAILSSLSGCSTNEISQSSSQSASTELSAEGQKNVAESADHSTKEAMDCLTTFYPEENIQDVSVQATKIEADILCADSVDSAPTDWESVQETAQEASTSLQSVASANGIQYGIIYLVDGQGNNLLTAMNGKISYDSFAEAVEYAGSNPPTINLEEFNAIQEGMDYQEVTNIVGSSGELVSESGMSGSDYYTQLRSWEGEGSLGANATVMFQGGVVVSKSQFGLQ